MYKNKTTCVVIPCFNEETQIENVVTTMPGYVDHLVVVDDLSRDRTVEKIKKLQKIHKKIVLIEHKINQGVGGAIASGYKWARDNEMELAVVMAGDGQMNPDDLPALLDPVADGTADYSKGNRLFTGEAFKKIPTIRYLGNSLLSLMTKITSGYWNVADSQSGYTVLNKKALNLIDWDLMYKRYGQPNDLLVRLNVENLRVTDVPVEPVYNVGEQSGIKIHKVIFTIGWLLAKLFLWRMKEKYIIRDFHPLVFFYFLGFGFGICTVLLFLRVFGVWYLTGHIPQVNALAAMFSFMSASQFSLFAMWFDMEANKHLKV
ncbi:MAG: glycosyltransferase family 2 protein [Desulfobacula sp.]|nr:glycosyltransferase family 2 protein [Desulfobacula sp.]